MNVFFIIVLSIVLVAPSAIAKRTRYIATDNRMNYVKLVEIGAKEAAVLSVKHPAAVDPEVLAKALRSVRVDRKHLTSSDMDELNVFNEAAVGYLSTNIGRALSEADANEVVYYSFLVKSPVVIIRSDRQTAGKIWNSADGLHMTFDVLAAKITGDTSKRGYEFKMDKKRSGVRMRLAYGECQRPGNTVDEIVFDLACVAGAAGSPQVSHGSDSSESQDVHLKHKVEAGAESIEVRLKKLEALRKKRLVSDEEYRKKKEEILRDL